MNGASDPAQLTAAPAPGAARRPVARLLLASFMAVAPLLASLVLLIYPWMERWERNGFAAWVPAWSSGYLRGAVSGLGGVSLLLSVSSIVQVRRRPPPA